MDVSIEPQCLHLIACDKITSAQYGHLFSPPAIVFCGNWGGAIGGSERAALREDRTITITTIAMATTAMSSISSGPKPKNAANIPAPYAGLYEGKQPKKSKHEERAEESILHKQMIQNRRSRVLKSKKSTNAPCNGDQNNESHGIQRPRIGEFPVNDRVDRGSRSAGGAEVIAEAMEWTYDRRRDKNVVGH